MGLGCGHRLWVCGLWAYGLWAYGLWAWAVGRYRVLEKEAVSWRKWMGKLRGWGMVCLCRRKNWNFLKISGFDFESAIFLSRVIFFGLSAVGAVGPRR